MAPGAHAPAEAAAHGRSDDESDSEDDCYSDSDAPRERRQDPDEDEKGHFLDVCYSFLEYANDAMHDMARLQDGLQEMSPEDRALWQAEPLPWVTEIGHRIEVNSQFLRLLPSPEVCGADLGPDGYKTVAQIPSGHRVASRNASKVRSTLRQFVRDWAREGEAERAASYGPIMEALLKHMPPRPGARAPAVLCPGCGLGRLPFDLARYGYAAQGNEFSYHMLLGSHLVLNRCTQAECFSIFPFVLSTTNRRGQIDHLRAVRIPDISPRTALPEDAELSMSAGEFMEVYKGQVAAWDAVATCFFLDTAKNIFLYIRTIAQIIRKGGLWVNLGPLLFHYADMEHEISVELSWEEVRPAICRYFKILDENVRVAHYTTNPGSLMGVKYRCIFFVAERNDQPPTGVSHPVF